MSNNRNQDQPGTEPEDVEGHRAILIDGDEDDVEGHVQPRRDIDVER